MEESTRELCGVPLWLLREYLFELGGKPDPIQPDRLSGPGWSVLLTQIEDFRLGSLVVGQVRVEMRVDPQAAAPFLAAFEKKLLRAGG